MNPELLMLAGAVIAAAVIAVMTVLLLWKVNDVLTPAAPRSRTRPSPDRPDAVWPWDADDDIADAWR